MCFAVVSPLTHNSEVPLGDHGEEMQVMGYFMSSTLGKSNQFLDQVVKKRNENNDGCNDRNSYNSFLC